MSHAVRHVLRRNTLLTGGHALLQRCAFGAGAAHRAKPLPPRPTVDEKDIEEKFLKGSGPGGQKINKTSSAVQLRHIPTGIVHKCQDTRSREQNRKIARRRLAERLEELEKGPESRTALKAEAARKKRASKLKKARRKYRRLNDEKREKSGTAAPGADDVADDEGCGEEGDLEGEAEDDVSAERERGHSEDEERDCK